MDNRLTEELVSGLPETNFGDLTFCRNLCGQDLVSWSRYFCIMDGKSFAKAGNSDLVAYT
jgi:hypothetical protein